MSRPPVVAPDDVTADADARATDLRACLGEMAWLAGEDA